MRKDEDMLRSVKELKNYKLDAQDGQMGRAKDFLFDDVRWTIRYMVVDTGGWLSGRQVLVSPAVLGPPNWSSNTLSVALTCKQIEASPSIDEDQPVSRQYELQMSQTLGYPLYWNGPHLWGMMASPYAMQSAAIAHEAPRREPDGDPHLRSVREVSGYHIGAEDGDVGHVEDFILDDESWTLRYVVVDTRNWLPGRKVLVSPSWVEGVDWSRRKVSVRMTKQEIKSSPEFDPTMPVNREYEARLYDFLGRPRYWQPEQRSASAVESSVIAAYNVTPARPGEKPPQRPPPGPAEHPVEPPRRDPGQGEPPRRDPPTPEPPRGDPAPTKRIDDPPPDVG